MYVRLLPFNIRMPLWLKFVDAMAEGQPDAPKKPADLRYVKLTSTGWTQPVSLYLLERIEGDKGYGSSVGRPWTPHRRTCQLFR